MKLRYKVSLLSLLVTTVTVSACSLLLLIQIGQHSIDLTMQNTLSGQKLLVSSWIGAMNTASSSQRGRTAERSLARYTFGQYAGETSILMAEKDVLFNRTGLDPSLYLPLDTAKEQYVIERIGMEPYLIIGSRVTARNAGYSVYTIHNIGKIFDDIRELAVRFSVIHIAALLLCGGALLFLLHFVFKPIGTLQKSTGEIADGVYSRRIHVEGDDEVAALAASFNRMADAIEARIRDLKNENEKRTLLLSALTHEMKTPLTAISGSAQTLLGTMMTEEEKEDALIEIDTECRRMESLSQKMMQLLLLRRTEELPLLPCNVRDLLDSAVASCAEQLRQRGLTLRTECEAVTLPLEKDLMTSLIINLIDNAGKASAPGSEILLQASDHAITVIDHGAGIPAEDLRHVLEPFYMGDKSRTRKAGGSGLGLALCDEIARLHHARLEIESRPETGTTVKVVFQDEA